MQGEGKNQYQSHGATDIFAMLVGTKLPMSDTHDFISAFRRMGLRPELLTDTPPDDRFLATPVIRLRFGKLAVLAGWPAPQMMEKTDPQNLLCSSVAGPFPDDWQSGQRSLAIAPDKKTVDGDDWENEQSRLRELFKMIVLLIDMFDASHLFWSPAWLWSDAEQMRGAIAEMTVSGMPPVLHLVAFRLRSQSAVRVLETRGLHHFSAQELRAEMPANWSSARAVKRLARIALDIMINGRIAEPCRIKGLEPGEWVLIDPSTGVQADGVDIVQVEFRQTD